MLAPFSGPWLVGTTKVYPGPGADIVMESIALKTRWRDHFECLSRFFNGSGGNSRARSVWNRTLHRARVNRRKQSA